MSEISNETADSSCPSQMNLPPINFATRGQYLEHLKTARRILHEAETIYERRKYSEFEKFIRQLCDIYADLINLPKGLRLKESSEASNVIIRLRFVVQEMKKLADENSCERSRAKTLPHDEESIIVVSSSDESPISPAKCTRKKYPRQSNQNSPPTSTGAVDTNAPTPVSENSRMKLKLPKSEPQVNKRPRESKPPCCVKLEVGSDERFETRSYSLKTVECRNWEMKVLKSEPEPSPRFRENKSSIKKSKTDDVKKFESREKSCSPRPVRQVHCNVNCLKSDPEPEPRKRYRDPVSSSRTDSKERSTRREEGFQHQPDQRFRPYKKSEYLEKVPKKLYQRRPTENCLFCQGFHWSHLCVRFSTLVRRRQFCVDYNLCLRCARDHHGQRCHIKTENITCKWPHCAAIGDHDSAFCRKAPYPISFATVHDYYELYCRE